MLTQDVSAMFLNNSVRNFHQLFTFRIKKINTKEFNFTHCFPPNDLTLLAPRDVSVNNEI
jgi:hypothetical protein